MAKETDNSIVFGMGLLAGVVAGIVIGVLYAPKSGEETRNDLNEKMQKIKEKFPSDVEKAKEKSLQVIERTKLSIENALEDIQESMKARKMANAKDMEEKSLEDNY
jgi:gas vesicle protein